jgi:hypothetical protein
LTITNVCLIQQPLKPAVGVFGPHYLIERNEVETTRIMAQNATRRYLEMLGSIIACISHGRIVHLLENDCTKGIMESAVWYLKLWKNMTCGFDMLFFSMMGSHNDINMLQCSPVFAGLSEGHAQECNYEINLKVHEPPRVVLLIDNNAYRLMVALSYVYRIRS